MAETLETLGRVVPGLRWEVAPPERANLPVGTGNRRGPLDAGRLAAERGFTPSFTLAAGLRDYVAWVRGSGEVR